MVCSKCLILHTPYHLGMVVFHAAPHWFSIAKKSRRNWYSGYQHCKRVTIHPKDLWYSLCKPKNSTLMGIEPTISAFHKREVTLVGGQRGTFSPQGQIDVRFFRLLCTIPHSSVTPRIKKHRNWGFLKSLCLADNTHLIRNLTPVSRCMEDNPRRLSALNTHPITLFISWDGGKLCWWARCERRSSTYGSREVLTHPLTP